MFMTVKQAAEKWGISDRRICVLCTEGKIPGTYRVERSRNLSIEWLTTMPLTNTV